MLALLFMFIAKAVIAQNKLLLVYEIKSDTTSTIKPNDIGRVNLVNNAFYVVK